jgi:hypothetical protein
MMRINSNSLRQMIREVIEEEMRSGVYSNNPTIPMPGRADVKIPRGSLGSLVAKEERIFDMIVQAGATKGMSSDEENQFRERFDRFMAEKDPGDKLIMTAEQIADEFMGKKRMEPFSASRSRAVGM